MKLLISIAVFSSFTSFAGVYEVKNIWPVSKRSLTVCIYFPKEDQLIKEAVTPTSSLINQTRNVILNTYTLNTTVIEFKGFEECNDRTESNIRVVFTKNDFGSGHAEQFSNSEVDKLRTVSIGLGNKLSSLSLGDTLKIASTLIHEFGHVVGLEHEHQYFRKEALRDPNCHLKTPSGFTLAEWIKSTQKFARQAGKIGALGLLGRVAPYYVAFKKGKKKFGSYDPESIMNYCYTQTALHPRLSNGDIETLRFMYLNH